MNWIREHSATIALMLTVLGGIVLGIILGGIFAFLSGFWLVVSGDLGDMLIVSWGMY
jgi:hypothetical protein